MGFVGPFMVALIPLASGLALALTYWRDDSDDRANKNTNDASSTKDTDTESGNPGIAGAEPITSTTEESGIVSTIQDALKAMNSDARIWFLGMAQALFEGAMYTFVYIRVPIRIFYLIYTFIYF